MFGGRTCRLRRGIGIPWWKDCWVNSQRFPNNSSTLPIKLPNISHMSSPFYWLDHLSCWLHQFSSHVCCLHSHCWFDSTTKWIFHSSNLSIYPVHGYIYIPWLLYTSRYTWEKMKEERSKMLLNKITNYGNLQEAVSFEYRRHMPTVSPMWPMCHESGEA